MDANGPRDSLHRSTVTSNSRSNDSTIKRFNVAKPFWRNVVLIALAHIALIAGLIRWTLAARTSSNPENIVWLGSAGDLAAERSENKTTPPPNRATPSTEPLENDEAQQDKTGLTAAKSEIELPSPTPRPIPSTTPKSTPTAPPKTKTTPKPVPKPTPKKTLMAKSSDKPAQKSKPSPSKASAKSEKKEKIALVKKDSVSQGESGKSGSTDKAGNSGGGSSASEFGWYGNMLHDRFYSAWIQPTTNVPSGAKISTLVNVRIEKDGGVSKFEIAKPSENATVNESVAAVAKQVSHVDPPPTGLIKGDHYDVKINFELNTEEGASK
jgi:TonB family protein